MRNFVYWVANKDLGFTATVAVGWVWTQVRFCNLIQFVIALA